MTSFAYSLQNVTKNYALGDREVSVLRGINLDIPVGQFVSIMGPSGSGKSTLLQLLGCLDTPSQGSVSILDQNTSRLSDNQAAQLRCRHIGFVFQSFHLLPYYDAVSNVMLSMVYSNRIGSRKRATQLLKGLGLGHRLYARPATLSGGEKQRVAIARSLGNNPTIILADEPTGALDQANGHAILDILRDLHQLGTTIVLVTHDPHVAERAERVVEIIDGQIHSDRRP